MEQTKNKGGRPAKQAEDRMVQRSIRMTPAMWAKIDASGGLAWLRETVRVARDQKLTGLSS